MSTLTRPGPVAELRGTPGGRSRVDWSPFATMVTPPAEVHSHHNGGPRPARFLIVQDGGWHYHARTMGFEFAE